MILLGGWVVGSFIMGIYLLISLNWFSRHSNEAFSSLAIEDYKSFLRMRITPDGELTIFPIGISKVAREWRGCGENKKGSKIVPADPRHTPSHLIEEPFPCKSLANEQVVSVSAKS